MRGATYLSAGLLWLALAVHVPGLGEVPALKAPDRKADSVRLRHESARVRSARRFLARRGIGGRPIPHAGVRGGEMWGARLPAPVGRDAVRAEGVTPEATAAPVWASAGPLGVSSLSYGLVSGRVSSVAFDPADATGNHVFVGTTGGGVWKSQNAAATVAGSVVFSPLTDGIGALNGVLDAGISVGAVSVQPGSTGVVLVGLGDPNDALDSYYGAGLLRSADGGATWTLIEHTVDLESQLSTQDFWFVGEGFAGFAWSTTSVQTVVAAVSQAYEGTLVNAGETGLSYEGLYYSQDGGVTWHLSRITDVSGADVQGPSDGFSLPDGNAATSVVWNSVRQVFIAAVRYHGYYQSVDGVNWIQLPFYPGGQPGAGFTAGNCPTQVGSVGVTGCPLFRGTLAVNPLTGDTFAWSVDVFNQDQGIWQDQCGITSGNCSNQALAFGVQLNTGALEVADENGPATIENGDYNLALSAVPAALAPGEDTLLFAGDNDLWKCSLANSCAWRNTTNASTCMSAAVASYQHAVAWDTGNPEMILDGNDGGLWRSLDQVGETGTVCSGSDAGHFQNLNASLPSLAEVESLAQSKSTASTMLAGLGANGFAGIVGSSASTAAAASDWNEVLGGEGGAVAIDTTSAINSWYANNGAGVSIFHCSSAGLCNAAGFGGAAVVGEAQVANDGLTMPYPAAFRLDAEDPTQMLVGTCRVWRGPASGVGWTAANAVSPTLDGADGAVGNDCDGDALIRTVAAAKTTSGSGAGGEVIYVAMAGAADGGGVVAGHVFSAPVSAAGVVGRWTDLTYSTVINDQLAFNAFGEDVGSLYVDPHDATGMTVYATISGFANATQNLSRVYRSTSGGAQWVAISANLPRAPANAVVVDSQDPNTVYVAMDTGVYVTRAVGTCNTAACWASYGTGLPLSPVTELVVTPTGASGPYGGQALTAGTYGRGIWQIPSVASGVVLTTAVANPTSLTFGSLTVGAVTTGGSILTISLQDASQPALFVTGITFSGAAAGDFSETDTCVGLIVGKGAFCAIKVSFSPTAAGSRVATMALALNVTGGQLLIPVSGTGLTTASVTLLPTSLAFGNQAVGTASAAQAFNIQNVGGSPVSMGTTAVTAPFLKGTSTCGTSLAAGAACAVNVSFAPSVAGVAEGTFSVSDGVGIQSAQLSGTGIVGPTDTLSATTVNFPNTVVGQAATPMAVTITNSGGLPLTTIGTSVLVSAGGGIADFTAVSNCGGQLAANASCGVSIGFAPTLAKGESATVTISDALRTQTVKVGGTGVKPAFISLTPTTLNLGSVQLNTPSAARTVTITNTGGAPLMTPGFGISGLGAASFSVVNSTGATACGTSVVPGGTCVLQVVFTPVVTGATTALLTVTTSSLGVAAASVALTGLGLIPPMLGVSPATENFGPVILGNSSALFTVQVTNVGQVTMSQPTFVTSGPQAGDFEVSAPTDLAACATALAPGATCNIQLTFSPSILGLETATLTVDSANAIPMTSTVSLSGTGMPVIVLQASPAQLGFPATAVGLTSTIETLTISDLGKKTANNVRLTITGPYEISSAATTCQAALTGNAFCVVGIGFSPVAAGDQPGSLTVQVTNAGVAPLIIPLDGSGVAVGGILPSPTQMTFGSVVVNTSSVNQTLTVTNSGQAAVTGLGIEVNGDYSLTANQCGTVLPAPLCEGGICTPAQCSTGVVFTPTSTGTRLGTLTISAGSVGVLPAVVSLTGSGSPPGSLSLTPAVTNFGSLTVGQTSAVQTVSVVNGSGGGAFALSGVQFLLAGDYGLTQNTCGTQIALGTTCSFGVTFSPGLTGTRIGSVSISSTTSGYIPIVEGLTGTGLPSAVLAVTPGFLQFGAVEVGTNSAALPLTVTNPGTGPLVGLSFRAAAPFSVGTGNCGTALAAGGSCVVPVTFTPMAGGLLSGVITVASSSLGVTAVQEAVSGTGVVAPALTLSPRTLSFGASTVGVPSAGQAVTVTNAGGLGLTGLTMLITGSSAADFAVGSSSCDGALAAGGSCSLLVSFKPTLAGGRTAFLTATSTTAGVASESTSLSGTGLSGALLGTSPAAVTFGTTLVGNTSGTMGVTVANSGQTGIADLLVTTTAGFAIDGPRTTCTKVLGPGGKCVVGVVFRPEGSGLVVGSLMVSSVTAQAGGTAAASTALSGTGGLPPGIVTSPAAVVAFGVTGVRVAASPVTITVTNQSSFAALNGLALTINAAGKAAGFGLSTNACAGGKLNAGVSCTVNVTFVPTAVGSLAGELVLTSSNGVGGTATLALSGVGYDFKMALVGAGTASVVAGQTAYYTIAVTPLAGVTGALGGAFNLACTGAPTNAFCLFNPPQLGALPANVSGNVLVALATGGPVLPTNLDRAGLRPAQELTGGSKMRADAGQGRWRRGWLALSYATVIPLLWWRRRYAFLGVGRRWLRIVPALALLMAAGGVVSGVSSCAGASGSGGQLHGGGGTPSGSYTVVVTASSSGVVHSVPVKLVVN